MAAKLIDCSTEGLSTGRCEDVDMGVALLLLSVEQMLF